MQSQRIKNVHTKIRKRILKGFPTRTQYVPIKNEAGKVLRFKTIIHLLKPFMSIKTEMKKMANQMKKRLFLQQANSLKVKKDLTENPKIYADLGKGNKIRIF